MLKNTLNSANKIVLLCLFLSSTHCGVRSIPMTKNKIDSAFAEINNQYKRRLDLIPNLVKTVKGYAKHEKQTLQAVVEARAKASQIKAPPLNSLAEMQKYQQAQSALGQALGRLMVVVERYPDLKANRSFLDLQSQLEGTENRITIARQRYIQTVELFNNLVTVFPTNITNSLFFKHQPLPQWAPEEGEKVKEVPKIEF